MRRKIIFIISILGLLSLQSCFVAKDYKQPDIVDEVLDEDKYRSDKISTDSLTMATLSWKELFKDPILQNYIEEGLENNIDIRVALQQINMAESYFRQGKAGYLPTLGAQAQAMNQQLSKNTPNGAMQSSMNQFELSGSLSWEADIWGKIRSVKRGAEADYLGTLAAHQAVKSRLISAIASTYYQLVTLDKQIEVTEKTIDTRQKSLRTTKVLKDAGRVTEVAVKQIEAQVYNAEALLVDLKNNSKLIENTLSILLGSGPKEITRGAMDIEAIDSSLQIGVPSQLLANRPDLRAAEYNLIAAFEQTNVTRSMFYPSLTLGINAGLQSTEIKDLFSSSSLFSGIVGGLAQPILQGRQIKTQHEVAKAQQENAKLNFMQTFLNASKEVSDALYSIQAAEEKIEFKEKEHEALATAVDYSQKLLNNGMADYLEVLRAEENALYSNIDLIDTQNAKLQSIIELYRALGGGWE